MSAETYRLIADRGHGLSRRQKDVLAAVARGEVAREYIIDSGYDVWRLPRRVMPLGVGPTVRSLEKRGLVELAAPMRSGNQAWQLTRPDGYALALRMGLIERADADGTPGDLYDPMDLPGTYVLTEVGQVTAECATGCAPGVPADCDDTERCGCPHHQNIREDR